MTLHIFVAKHVADPRRWEPKNIGVVVADDDRAAARFIGERGPGQVDRRSVRYLAGDTEVYEEWIRYWRRAVAEGPAGVEAAARGRSSNYVLMEQGQVWTAPEDTTVEQLVDRYYASLVESDGVSAAAAASESLAASTDRVIEAVEQRVQRRVRRNFEIAHSTSPVRERLRFNYGMVNGHVTVAQRVPLVQELYAHDALYKLIYLPSDIDGRRVVAVTFVRGDEEGEAADLLPFLREKSQVVDLSQPDAVERATAIFAA